MKKLLLLTFLFMFAFNAVSFAAVSGSKSRTSSPTSKPPTSQTSPAKSGSSDYKPSAPAQSYGEKAPAAAAKPNTQAAQPPSQSGGFLRTAGLLGGGMLLGSMLGGMFGFGNSGMFANIIGMLFNVMLLAGVFMAGRFLWNKFKNRDRDSNQRYR
jgi:predicted lipid-binding transport protein (Tim44 family)